MWCHVWVIWGAVTSGKNFCCFVNCFVTLFLAEKMTIIVCCVFWQISFPSRRRCSLDINMPTLEAVYMEDRNRWRGANSLGKLRDGHMLRKKSCTYMYISFKKLSPSNRTWPPMPYVDFQPWRSLWNYRAYLHETGLFSAVGHAISSFSCLWFCVFFGTTNMVVEAYQATLDGEIYRDLAQPCGTFEYGKFLQHIINLKVGKWSLVWTHQRDCTSIYESSFGSPGGLRFIKRYRWHLVKFSLISSLIHLHLPGTSWDFSPPAEEIVGRSRWPMIKP